MGSVKGMAPASAPAKQERDKALGVTVEAQYIVGEYDILISTSIIESGLDIPRANTILIDRADSFGLAQLYQLRGRVGRSKARAYAYLTMPPNRTLTPAAEKRLRVLQSLDALGAGFTLASHDLDIRGAGTSTIAGALTTNITEGNTIITKQLTSSSTALTLRSASGDITLTAASNVNISTGDLQFGGADAFDFSAGFN